MISEKLKKRAYELKGMSIAIHDDGDYCTSQILREISIELLDISKEIDSNEPCTTWAVNLGGISAEPEGPEEEIT